MPRLTWLALAGLTTGLVLGACRSSFEEECSPGTQGCECLPSGGCDDGLACMDGLCISQTSDTSDTNDTNASMTDGGTMSSTSGDGDDSTTGDGDSSSTSGDGDSSTTSGDGDSSTTSGDGDSSTTSGDGDSSTTGGDGDSGTTTGDGDGGGDGDTGTGPYCGSATPILTFGPTVTTPTPTTMNPLYISVGDVYGGPRDEVIVAGIDLSTLTSNDTDGGRVTVYRQNGALDGLETDPILLWDSVDLPDTGPLGTEDKEYSAHIVTDLDDNADPDLVILSRHAIHWFMHTDTDTLTLAGEFPTGDRLRTPVSAEFYEGGAADLAIAQDSPGGWEGHIIPVEGGMPAPLDPALTYPMQANRPHDAKGADLSGNGAVDLVYLHSGPDDNTPGTAFSVVLNTATSGPPTFPVSTAYATGAGPHDLELIDLDGDTDLDLVISSLGADITNPTDRPADWSGPGPESLYVFLNDGAGAFAESESIVVADRLSGTAAGDFDCDGETDVMVGTMRGSIYFLAGDGNGSFAAPELVLEDIGTIYGMDVSDMNNDGRLDLVWGDVLNKQVVIAYQQ